MRKRDPRRVAGGGRQARALVRILDLPESPAPPDGSVTTRQKAELTLAREELDRLWTPEYLERLARTYWRFLTRVSLGMLRVRYTEAAREIVMVGRPLVLLRFLAPEYDIGASWGSVTWRVMEGLLVHPAGRGQGHLRISVRRPADDDGSDTIITATVDSEVASFYPLIAGRGWLSRLGRHVYRATQLRIHVVVTHAFLRSLARLELEPSMVGALAPPIQRRSNSGETTTGHLPESAGSHR